MGIEKQGSKGGTGLLHLFDWSAKSRKKLFSSKTDNIPEKSKQKKNPEGNRPTTRLRMLDEYGLEAGLRSMKESSDYRCASSLTEDSFHTSKAPNLVARLMGLDYLPTQHNFLEPSSSFRSTHYRSKSLEHFQDFTESKDLRVVEKPIKVFKTEVKDLNIIDTGVKKNLSLSSSSSSTPSKIRELKEKVQAVKKPSKSDCDGVRNLKGGHSKSKSLNGSDKNESTQRIKSISLALQAKANVQKREALNSNNSKKEKNDQSMSTSQRSATPLERPFLKKGTNVLRQNNQKQNCYVDRKKPEARKKPLHTEVPYARQRNSSKPVGPSRVKDERDARKKQSLDGNHLLKKGKNGKNADCATGVVSFTFNAPMTRPGSVGSDGAEKNLKVLSTDFPSKRTVAKLSSLRHNAVSNLRSRVPNPGYITIQTWQGPLQETGLHLECRFPSPVSVLERFPISESCSSLDTADSNSTGVKSCSSIQFHDSADLSDTASSASAKTASTSWMLGYVKELMTNIEPMFKDYALGKTKDVIKPRLFRQLENRKGHPKSRMNRRLVFDCVNECLDLRCRKYAFAGYELWAKGLRTVERKSKLADDLCKEISGWGSMGNFMVDEIVESDMSGKNGSSWLEYEVELFEVGVRIESRILSALVDEVVDDILDM